MAQTLKSKINKLSQAYSITAIIDTAKEIQKEQADIQAWEVLTTEEKTQWFMDQCAKYNLTTKIVNHNDIPRRIYVDEFDDAHTAYFTVFLPHPGWEIDGLENWHLEIGGAYVGPNNGGIWVTHPGLKGKERQIAEVMRLHNLGE
jgi:hypothetical protein